MSVDIPAPGNSPALVKTTKQKDSVSQEASLSLEARTLVEWFNDHRTIAVAFSGGVDSSVVLAAAMRNPATCVTAVTADSPSVARWQVELSIALAEGLGATHQIIKTNEVELPAYIVNDSRRCFHCKSTLYESLRQVRQQFTGDDLTIVSGTNADDLGDYRPGIAAGDDAGVLKPLAELGFGKTVVRRIASEFGLPNADLPASPCLASRIAYGVEVTPERLWRVEQAEDYLGSWDLTEVRVRLHADELARIEVPLDQIEKLTSAAVRKQLSDHFAELGFQYITIDLQGFSSGSMNRQLVSLQHSAPKHNIESTETS